MGKELCNCGKIAVWLYLPSSKISHPFYCDDCVISEDNKIGCSCNWNYSKEQDGLPLDLPKGIEGKDWRWVICDGDENTPKITKEDGFWLNLDRNGKPYPCCEYDYDENGYDIDE